MTRWTRRTALLLPLSAAATPAVRRELRDPNGRLLGWLAPRPGGVLEARDRAGRLLGTYDPAGNETRDRNGRLLYRGEALSALIVCHGGG
ncbi:MAG: hypothetical protein NZR01_03820 [Bryobacteraceae bacterium]|nr:hypothetical protein [Bryobacteraceae bacterium]